MAMPALSLSAAWTRENGAGQGSTFSLGDPDSHLIGSLCSGQPHCKGREHQAGPQDSRQSSTQGFISPPTPTSRGSR